LKKRNLTLFSLQYVPMICKVVKYGHSVNIIGPKKHLYLTSYPLDRVHYACNALSHCYFIPTIPIPGFLNMTLCPSNQIIHTGRVYGVFQNWDGKSTFEADKFPLLYEDLDDSSAREIQYLDDEIQAIKKNLLARFPELQLT
jgi:opine dehydrogenase